MSDWDNEFGGDAFDLEVEREKRKLGKASGKKFNNLQQLKDEILAIADHMEKENNTYDGIEVLYYVKLLRETSSV